MRFIKFHGYGNDYIVCEAEQLAGTGWTDDLAPVGAAAGASFGDFVRRVCERHHGAGADGIAVVSPLRDAAADFRVRIFNADGSEAAMSGNGSRCAAAYLYYQKMWSGEELRLGTRAGIKRYRLRETLDTGVYRFEAEIGQPLFDNASIPLLTDEPLQRVQDYPIRLTGGEIVPVTALQMCNPNCCVFVDDFASVDWRRLGKAIESHLRFPEKTNVIFVLARDRANIEARVWERGVGETLSSGTGACAAAVASNISGRADRRVTVEMHGGRLEVEWRDDGEVLLTGIATVIYRGEWLGEGMRAEG